MYTQKYPINHKIALSSKDYPKVKSTMYITIGDEYSKPKPKTVRLRKMKGDKWSDEWKFVSNPKKGQTAGYFNKYEYKEEPYVSTKTYLPNAEASNAELALKKDYKRDQETFEAVARKDFEKRENIFKQRASLYQDGNNFRAFGSADCSRRDEFSLNIRQTQWRERLKTEENFTKASILASAGKTVSKPLDVKPGETVQQAQRRHYKEKYADNPELFQTQVPFNLYDIGKESSTPFCNKSARDTFYDMHRVANMGLRRPGSCPTSYETYGNFDYYPTDKPKYGRITETKHFFDHSHLGN
jgi:hypothetical protein